MIKNKFALELNSCASHQSEADNIFNDKLLELKSQDACSSEIWSIRQIVSTIFSYCEFKDLIEFNGVCKKWNKFTNPTIHRNIKMFRSKYIKQKTPEDTLSIEEKIDAEIRDCISNNAKFAPFIKNFRYYEDLKPQRAIEFFEVFRNLTRLHFCGVEICQDQFLCMIKPLNKLEILTFFSVTINGANKNRFTTEVIKLPSTLTKLSLIHVKLTGTTELFINYISSHSNLNEFVIDSINESNLLIPFYQYCPRMMTFEYRNSKLESPKSLIKVFESNTQIKSLKLGLKCFDNNLLNHININLKNLVEFDICSLLIRRPEIVDNSIHFTGITKIKKLKVTWDMLSSFSLNSILKNSPEVQEFTLKLSSRYINNYFYSIKLETPTNIKKLNIAYANLTISSLDSILLNCPYLKDLEVILDSQWKRNIEIINQRCANLEHLKLISRHSILDKNDYSSLKFLSGNFTFKNTLISLTLIGFSFENANSLHFQDYSKLKSIKFPYKKIEYSTSVDEIDINLDNWPNYKSNKYGNGLYYGIELIKP